MISFWIFLALSIFHSALAVPVAVGEILEVRSNPAEVPKDERAKRLDLNNKDLFSTYDSGSSLLLKQPSLTIRARAASANIGQDSGHHHLPVHGIP
jgi:hypothetical protein